MTRKVLIPALSITLLIIGVQCKRHNTTEPTLLGQVLFLNPCSSSVIQVQSPNFDRSRVLATWTDPDNDSVYHNVFAVIDAGPYCNISGYGVKQGDVITFQFWDNAPLYICNTCAMQSPTPSVPPVVNSIINVKEAQLTSPN